MSAKPWEIQKRIGLHGPHKVTKDGFKDQLVWVAAHPAIECMTSEVALDKMRVGKIDQDGRRYMGNGCYERVNVEESNLNDLR